jgi:hypothetical protein
MRRAFVVVAGTVILGSALCAQGCGKDESADESSDASPDGAPPPKQGGGATDSAAPGVDGALPTTEAGAAADPSVYQHHNHGTRDGVYTDLNLNPTNAGTIHTLPGFLGTVSMAVYAQPLYVEKGPGGNETLIIATETNHVTAFNALTGATLWDQGPTTYGTSVSSGLPCGTISPLGILGTPFIDPASPINGGAGVIYFDAMNNTTPAKHMVYAVKLEDGTVLPNWPVDVSATVPNFVSNYQNQRGALQFLNGVLYVAYSGLNGDCTEAATPYYGWVIGFPAADPQHPTGWHTMAPRGGIWGPGSLPTDGTSIFPVTGNTETTKTSPWGGGEAVIRLGPGPTFSGNTTDYYAPTNWQAMDSSDADLGGANEVLFDLPGTSKPHLVGAGGKDSHVYILNRDNLGGIGAELFNQSMATSQFKGSPAVYTTKTATYLAMRVEGGTSATPCPNGRKGNLVVMKVTGGTGNPTVSVAWCSVETNLASPMVTTTDGTSNAIVWDADNALVGYDGDTGMEIVTGTNTAMSTAIEAWNTPIAIGKGRISIGVKGQLYVFTAP